MILKKVPEITLLFWILKLLTTAMGESFSDFLVHSFNPILVVIVGLIGFLLAIGLQFSTKKYVAWVYWLALTSVAIFGTMAADVVHIVLGVPYVISVILFSIALAVVFFIWHKTERTLSIHSITTPRRELFYWLTVVIAFALGTAAGDTTAASLNLGYLVSGIVFGVLFLLPFIIRTKFKVSEVATFWLSYIFTRPLGASFADWFGRTRDLGGIGFGTGKTTIVLTILIVILVAYTQVKQTEN